jgi:hypothetical protein
MPQRQLEGDRRRRRVHQPHADDQPGRTASRDLPGQGGRYEPVPEITRALEPDYEPRRLRPPVGFRNSVRGRRAASARRSIASLFPVFGGCAWAGRSSIWDSAGCCSWSRCCANRSVRRNLRSCCCDMSWRSCAGSRGGHRFDPWIEQFSRRSPGRYRGGLGQVCRCVRRRFCAGTGSWSGGDGRVPTDGRRAAAARSSGTGARRSTRTREPVLGLLADRRRTARPWHLDFGDIGADDRHPPRSAAGAAARRALLAQLPPPTRGDDARLRFLHR